VDTSADQIPATDFNDIIILGGHVFDHMLPYRPMVKLAKALFENEVLVNKPFK
jgi:hypothetical protein